MNEFIPVTAGKTPPPAKFWWTLWAALLASQFIIYTVLGRGPLPALVPGANPFANLIGFVPLFVSIVIRWLVLPRSTDPMAAFVMFVVGLALADACGILGIFLGGPYRDSLFVLGVLGIVQYAPFYVRKLFEPKVSGFIPNN